MDELVVINDTRLKEIADAIRDKNHETEMYYPSDMPEKIRNIEIIDSGCWVLLADT